LAVPARADRIETTGGRVFDGKVLGRVQDPARGEVLKIRIGSSMLELPASQVRSIRPSTPAEDALLAAGQAIDEGRLSDAPAALDEALRQGIDPAAAAALFLAHGDALAAGADAFTTETRLALSHALAGTRLGMIGRDDDLRPVWLELHLALGEREAADRLFQSLGPRAFTGQPALRERLTLLLVRSLDRLTRQGRFEAARDVLADLERVDPAQAADRRTRFYLQWAWSARQDRRYEDALQIYLGNVLDDTPLIGKDRIAVTLNEAEDYYRSRDELPVVARLWTDYGLAQLPGQAAERLVQLWRDEGWRQLRRAAYPKAREAFGRADQFQPGGARDDLRQVEYREKRDALAAPDPVGHFNLGVWCQDRSMWNQALEEYKTAAQQGLPEEIASQPIAQIEAKIAEDALLKIMDMYQAGQFGDALAAVHDFMQEPHPTGFLAQARQIEQLTLDAVHVRVAERPQQAEALYQQAERAYGRQHYSECAGMLRTLIQQYGDTVVAERARTLFATVRSKLALASLEEGRAPAALDLPTSASDNSTTTSEIDRLIRNLGRMNY
jgi:hypothetical protein